MYVEEWDVEEGWRCVCGRVCPGLSGAERESLRCTHCGHCKTEEDPWVTPDPNSEQASRTHALTGEAARKAEQEPVRACPYCGTEQREGSRECTECGAAPARPRPEAPEQLLEPSPLPVAPAPPPTPGPAPLRPFQEPERGLPAGLWLALGAALLALGGLGLSRFLREEIVPVEVTGLEWEATTRWEVRTEHETEGWRNQTGNRHVLAWGSCGTRQQGTRDCNPHPGNCRPDISCNCRGGETYSCPPCSGGGTQRCRCRPTGAYPCRCSTSITSRRNGAARVTRSCAVCYTGETCDQCPVPRTCRTCTRPRVCERCPRDRCETLYDTCPVMGQWCRYRYDQWDPQPELRASGTGHGVQVPRPPGVSTPDLRSRSTQSFWITYTERGPDRRHWRLETDANAYGAAWVGSLGRLRVSPLGARLETKEATP